MKYGDFHRSFYGTFWAGWDASDSPTKIFVVGGEYHIS